MVLGLQKRGHECLVGLAKGARFHLPDAYLEKHPALPVIPLDGTSGTEEGRRLAVAGVARHFKPDVIVPVMLADGLSVAASMKVKSGFAVVYPIHELNAAIQRDLENFREALDIVVPVDAKSGEQIPPKLHTRRIPCGVPMARTGRTTSKVEEAFRVGYCGRLERHPKRIWDVVDIWHKLSHVEEAELVIAGDGSQRAQLLHALTKQGPKERVHFFGARSRDELYRDFYPSLDALIVTSDQETGPLVAFEAMMHEVPVVSSSFRGLKEGNVFKDRENCLVFSVGDCEGAAQRLGELRDSNALRRRLGRNGFDYVSKERTLTAMWNAWSDVLAEAVSMAALKKKPLTAPVIVPLKGRVKEYMRRALGRRFVHDSVRSEWPFYSA